MQQPDSDLEGPGSVRRANLRRALQLVFRNPGVQTRAGIARSTGLTASTASSLVAELVESGYVAEGPQAVSTGGKRATTLSIDGSRHLLLAVIVRSTDAIAALVALDGATVHQERISYAPTGRDDALETLLAGIAGRFRPRILSAAIQITGATDGRVVLESVQLGLRDAPLAHRYEKILGVPVRLVNDVDAEAIAEITAQPDPRGHMLFVHIGAGIGASVTLDGEIAPGPHARAGEIGHVQVLFGDDAPLCRCGLRGCLESSASMTAMLGDGFTDGMEAAEIAALAATVDPARVQLAASALARTIKLLMAMLDPTETVIGGPITRFGDGFLSAVRAQTAYSAGGTMPVPVRYARADLLPYAGVAQVALSAALGVRWSPGTLVLSPGGESTGLAT